MAANGISELATKEARQTAKLDIAEAKRQGKTVAIDGTITGSLDSTKPYYRSGNVYDITALPTQYNSNSITDNSNIQGGVITSISLITPVYRTDGDPYNAGTTTVQFSVPLDFTTNPAGTVIPGGIQATGTPVYNGSGQLSGINLIQGGLGYQKLVTVGMLNGQVLCDVIIEDLKPGDPDSREMRDITLGLNMDASDVTYGLLSGRPWTTGI